MVQSSIFKTVSALILISALGYILIPNMPFDYCMLQPPPSYSFFNVYECTNWPWFVYGAAFVLIVYFVGPHSLWFRVCAAILFCLISIFEHLSFGEHIYSVIAWLPYSPFVHGAAVSLITIFITIKCHAKFNAY